MSAFRPWYCSNNSKFPRKTTPIIKYWDTQYKNPKAVTVCLLSEELESISCTGGKRLSVPSVPSQDTCNACRGISPVRGWIYSQNFNPSLASWNCWQKRGCILGRTKRSNFNRAPSRTAGRTVFCQDDIPLITSVNICSHLTRTLLKELLWVPALVLLTQNKGWLNAARASSDLHHFEP